MKPEELKQKIEKGEVMELLDVREKDEYNDGFKIAGSKNIPMGQALLDAASGKLLKDKQIVTICKSGKRAEIVASELVKKGYVADYLEGGMEAWENMAG